MDIKNLEDMAKVIKSNVGNRLDLRKDYSDEEVREIITELVFQESQKTYLTVTEKAYLVDTVFNSMRKLDVLQPLIDDKSITEIMINGPNNIFVEKDGKVFRIEDKFENKEKLEDVIQSVVSKVNRTVNESKPIVDARLEDGSRVNVVLPPIALNGPYDHKKVLEEPMTVERLISYGSITRGCRFVRTNG